MRISARLMILALVISQIPLRAESLYLPTPPQQHASWTAPADLPTNLVSAVNTLFTQGFPDPRGCEYREIEVTVSGVWGGKTLPAKTRGWLLPAKARHGPRFAICWNGVIYPVTEVGELAELHVEATNLVPPAWWRFKNAIGEIASVYSTNASSTRVLLLLRRGETATALKNWSPDERLADSQARTRTGAVANYDPYLQLAGDWAWALFDATISAHMRGEEDFALATARKLAEVQPRIEAEAARRGFPRPKYYDSARPGKEKPYLDFLDQLPQLLTDLERREHDHKRAGIFAGNWTNIVNQTERIVALIRDLEVVQARQWGQPGAVNLGEDPVVGALIREGDAAVEPLLVCLETDKRLTRSVGFPRDFFRNRTVIPVASAARTALQAILHASFGSAAEMRAYWRKYGALKLEERWYAILLDDQAGMGRWNEAAANIVQPENVRTFPGTGFSIESGAPTNAPVKLLGEVLRPKAGPSVSELLTRRAVELPPDNPENYDLHAACEMGLRLAAWDRTAALPVAKVLAERCRAVLEYSDGRNREGVQRAGALLARLTVVRAENGDPQAFDDYVAWLKTASPNQLEHALAEGLEPLHRFRTNQVLQAAAEGLFSVTNQVWGRLPWKAGSYRPEESKLVELPAFRRLLSRELDRKEPCGVIEWRGANNASFQMTNYLSGSRGLALREADQPSSGTKTELRWCDWIAWSLFNSKQIAYFNPFAPGVEREKAIQDAKAMLERP